ncbi:MAG: acyltransferase [Bacteroidota bacterium]
MKKLEFIDFAKGISIFAIAFFHFGQFISNAEIPSGMNMFFAVGGSGIHLFLFLSGFGLSLSKPTDAFSFFKRRFFKVYTPFAITVTLIFLSNYIWHIYLNQGVREWLSNVFLYKMFDFTGNGDLNASFGDHFWFIGTIIQFYIVFPVLVFLLKKLGSIWFLVLCFTTSFAYWYFLDVNNLFYHKAWSREFPQFLWEFALGMVAAELYKTKNFEFWRLPLWQAILATIVCVPTVFLLVKYLGRTGQILNEIPSLILFTSLVVIAFQIFQKYIPSIKQFFIGLGNYSFALYLSHIWVLCMYGLVLQSLGITINILHLPVFLALATVIAFYYNKVVEFIQNKRAPKTLS